MKKFLTLAMLFIFVLSFLNGAFADRIPEEHDASYIGAMRVVKCNEWVTLRNVPYKTGKALAKVPLGSVVYNCRTIKEKKSFLYAEYEGLQGYILKKYLETAPEFEPAVTSAVSQKMTMEELTATGDIVLEWNDFNISVVASHEYVPKGNIKQEILRVGCFIDGEPLWGHIETLDAFNDLDLLRVFIGGTEDDPMVMLYDGGYGLTMFDLLSGSEQWTVMKGSCDLGDASVIAVDNDDGTMYIAGSDRPDPVAITPEGRIMWISDTENPDLTHPFEIALRSDSIQVKYGENPDVRYYIASFDYMGELTGVREIEN